MEAPQLKESLHTIFDNAVLKKMESQILLFDDLIYSIPHLRSMHDHCGMHMMSSFILGSIEKSELEKSLKKKNCDFNVTSTHITAKFLDDPTRIEFLCMMDRKNWCSEKDMYDIFKNIFLDGGCLDLKEKIKSYIENVCITVRKKYIDTVIYELKLSFHENPSIWKYLVRLDKLKLTMLFASDPIINMAVYILDQLINYAKLIEDTNFCRITEFVQELFEENALDKLKLILKEEGIQDMLKICPFIKDMIKYHPIYNNDKRESHIEICHNYLFWYLYTYVENSLTIDKPSIRYPKQTMLDCEMNHDVCTYPNISEILQDIFDFKSSDGLLLYTKNEIVKYHNKLKMYYESVDFSNGDDNELLNYKYFPNEANISQHQLNTNINNAMTCIWIMSQYKIKKRCNMIDKKLYCCSRSKKADS